MFNLCLGIIIPFLGTTIGALFVFFLRNKINNKMEKILLGFAGGVMMAASVWSLIIPAIAQSADLDLFSFIPALVGIMLGVLFLILVDKMAFKIKQSESVKVKQNHKSSMLMFAVTLHNIPEGMAVGVALAGAYFGNAGISIASGLALSIGIAVQNIPEGAIISMPLLGQGFSKKKAFGFGVLSGIVEPIFAVLTLLLVNLVTPILPYLLSFAAGAMIYVVVEELIPQSQGEEGSKIATVSFILGFLIMMVLDVALG